MAEFHIVLTLWNDYVTIAGNRNLSNCENSPEKGFSGLQRDSNPWPLRQRYSALPAELKRPIYPNTAMVTVISFVFPQFTSFHSVFHSFHGLMNSINWPASSIWIHLLTWQFNQEPTFLLLIYCFTNLKYKKLSLSDLHKYTNKQQNIYLTIQPSSYILLLFYKYILMNTWNIKKVVIEWLSINIQTNRRYLHDNPAKILSFIINIILLTYILLKIWNIKSSYWTILPQQTDSTLIKHQPRS